MSILNFKNYQVHYEINGTGDAILILNGIMMSTKSWEPFVNSLSKHNQLIRVDFLDQGQSSRLTGEYTQEIQVEVVLALLDHLKIEKINLVGISYGGEVSILFASMHPSRVKRLLLFNTAAYTSPWLAEIGHKWNSIGRLRDGKTYYQATIPVIYSPSFYEQKLEWMKKRETILNPVFSNPVFLDAMERLTNSAEKYDARNIIKNIKAKTLIVAADEDYLTPMPNQKELHQIIANSELIIIPGVGHASMYEVPMLFASLVLGFVLTEDETYLI